MTVGIRIRLLNDFPEMVFNHLPFHNFFNHFSKYQLESVFIYLSAPAFTKRSISNCRHLGRTCWVKIFFAPSSPLLNDILPQDNLKKQPPMLQSRHKLLHFLAIFEVVNGFTACVNHFNYARSASFRIIQQNPFQKSFIYFVDATLW